MDKKTDDVYEKLEYEIAQKIHDLEERLKMLEEGFMLAAHELNVNR